jgi:ribosomal protein RSM22 (predicted rRNA methylase)
MESTLQNDVKIELCPNGIWQLKNIMESLLTRQISKLPKSEVSETDTRYPTTPASMRAFLEVFFTRHYFQIQNSLLDYITSDDFLNILESGQLQILDIGCGPAVASLAITDMLSCVIKNLKETVKWPKTRTIEVNYILNDTSGICLGTGQQMLTDYFRRNHGYGYGITRGQVISTQKAFPDNMSQLERIKLNLGAFDVVILSYVVVPLSEDNGLKSLVDDLLNIEKLCKLAGRILILQDKFQEALIRRIGREIENSSKKQTLTQEIFPRRNENETHTYTYYQCLYAPRSADVQSAMA